MFIMPWSEERQNACGSAEKPQNRDTLPNLHFEAGLPKDDDVLHDLS